MRSPVYLVLALARTHARAHTLCLLHAEVSPASQPVYSRASKRGTSIKGLRLPVFSRRGLSRMRLNKSRGQASLALPWLCSLYLLPFWLWISTPSCSPHPRCWSLFRSPSCLCSLFSSPTSVFHFPPRTHHQPLSPVVLSLPLLPPSLPEDKHPCDFSTTLVPMPLPLPKLRTLRNRRSPSRPEALPLLLTRGLPEAGLHAKAPPAGQVQCDRSRGASNHTDAQERSSKELMVHRAGPATAPQEHPPRPASSKRRVLHILLLTPRPNLFRTPKLVSVRDLQAVHPPESPGSVVIVGEAPTFHSISPSPLLSGETTTFGA